MSKNVKFRRRGGQLELVRSRGEFGVAGIWIGASLVLDLLLFLVCNERGSLGLLLYFIHVLVRTYIYT